MTLLKYLSNHLVETELSQIILENLGYNEKLVLNF